MKSQTLADFKRDVAALPFWVKLVGGLLMFFLAPFGWILGFILIVVLNWPVRD